MDPVTLGALGTGFLLLLFGGAIGSGTKAGKAVKARLASGIKSAAGKATATVGSKVPSAAKATAGKLAAVASGIRAPKVMASTGAGTGTIAAPGSAAPTITAPKAPKAKGGGKAPAAPSVNGKAPAGGVTGTAGTAAVSAHRAASAITSAKSRVASGAKASWGAFRKADNWQRNLGDRFTAGARGRAAGVLLGIGARRVTAAAVKAGVTGTLTRRARMGSWLGRGALALSKRLSPPAPAPVPAAAAPAAATGDPVKPATAPAQRAPASSSGNVHDLFKNPGGTSMADHAVPNAIVAGAIRAIVPIADYIPPTKGAAWDLERMLVSLPVLCQTLATAVSYMTSTLDGKKWDPAVLKALYTLSQSFSEDANVARDAWVMLRAAYQADFDLAEGRGARRVEDHGLAFDPDFADSTA